MAAFWGLPVIYIIENNRYAMGTSAARSSSIKEHLYKRGEGFNIKGEAVDGMDVTAVYEAGAKAVDYVRKYQRPYILEMETYRYRGHSMSDPATYRTEDEVSEYKNANDPITNLAKRLDISEDELKKWDKEIKKEMAEAVRICTTKSRTSCRRFMDRCIGGT